MRKLLLFREDSKCKCFSKWYSQSLWIAPNYPSPPWFLSIDLSYSKSQLWLYFRILWPTFCCNYRKLCLLILDLHVDGNDTLAGELLLKLLAASKRNRTPFGPNSHSGPFVLFYSSKSGLTETNCILYIYGICTSFFFTFINWFVSDSWQKSAGWFCVERFYTMQQGLLLGLYT